jgi:hypothetical protein
MGTRGKPLPIPTLILPIRARDCDSPRLSVSVSPCLMILLLPAYYLLLSTFCSLLTACCLLVSCFNASSFACSMGMPNF